jgi:hypothetical protein
VLSLNEHMGDFVDVNRCPLSAAVSDEQIAECEAMLNAIQADDVSPVNLAISTQVSAQ